MALLDELNEMTQKFLDSDKRHTAFRDEWETVRENVVRTECEILVSHLSSQPGPWKAEFKRENGASVLTLHSIPPQDAIRQTLRFEPNWQSHKIVVVPKTHTEREEFDVQNLTCATVDRYIRRTYEQFLSSLGARNF